MKIILISVMLAFSCPIMASANIESERRKCDQIICDDLRGEDEYRCRQQVKNCHMRVFEMQQSEWQEKGVSLKVRNDVLESLAAAKKRNQDLITRLKKEIELMESDIKQIDAQIEKMNSLKINR